jgi:hypothetical protein
MNINQDTFSRMLVCQQIRLYTDFGTHFLDIDHATVLAPSWMNDAINNQPKNDVANCISQEGFYRLSLLAGKLDSKENISLAIHALIYKANELNLLEYPQVQPLLDAAVCKNDLDNEWRLISIYYFAKYTNPPNYISQSDATERMQAELCNK